MTLLKNTRALSRLGLGMRHRKTSSVVGLDVKTDPKFQSGRGTRNIFRAALLLICCGGELLFVSNSHADETGTLRGDLLLIIGSPGTDDYRDQFRSWGTSWTEAARAGGVRITTLGMQHDEATLEKLHTTLNELPQAGKRPLWIVLLGHGTFDGRTAKFNLPGDDLTPERFAEMLEPIQRPMAVIQCAAASGPFLEKLSAPNRIVLTATSSGNEVNFSRFGRYLAESLQHREADLDKDQQVSLLETFLRAVRLTDEYYAGEGQLATEHARLDDNGDGRAVPASGFDGIRPVHRQDRHSSLPDGVLSHQWVFVPNAADARLTPEELAQRHQLEREISLLQERRSELSEDDYYTALEQLFVRLARLIVSPPGVENDGQPGATPSAPSS